MAVTPDKKYVEFYDVDDGDTALAIYKRNESRLEDLKGNVSSGKFMSLPSRSYKSLAT